jgi:hypothetical protein
MTKKDESRVILETELEDLRAKMKEAKVKGDDYLYGYFEGWIADVELQLEHLNEN